MLYELFERCLQIEYNHTENSADYAIERIGNTLYIYFEHSNGAIDWKNNFDFPAKPYKEMSESTWFAHRGFIRVFKSIEPHIKDAIMDPYVQCIISVGYSHGAAIATLCHEYAYFNRPDIRYNIYGYGFGSPRVIWGIPTGAKALRWERFTVIRNIDDIVTHLPPVIMGYFHVGKTLEIGKRGKYTSVDAHRPENILIELKIYENEKKKLPQ